MKTKFQVRILLVSFTLLGAIFLMSYKTPVQHNTVWSSPKSADTLKNPLKGNVASIEKGKKIYDQYCVVCHGQKGRGNGIAASTLNPRPADHASAKFQAQTDGAIYWKLTHGNQAHSAMTSYAKILSNTQRWEVVDYIRTLKAKTK
ncbi:MAG TPA: c-type cytochrome [Bacteroidia bacterium]|nr:c-type cytochrome [Bacteroidia bacterium]